ncbi:DUF4062 domain-containing protein [Polaribacter sp. PL03]|uniref:DUF4062 domain-containing protein n=1 Tax=Polaribacter sp. PL03 TaxID=3088353 RepID=UPI0029D408BD|nr:DUF4062 domain-containing protein [Polaribacter sp. PL03]MDX6748156.1 DUF4062 domain-containing protein [Polaribacter sp. PL03]
MDKRYQVFVSSTYKDLIPERVEVIQALLELDCIPSGMEYFPAADETQWDFIKKLIDESDYYIVIIAGKYGSVDDNGISYTQKEYEYAISKNIPTIAFLHSDIDSLPTIKTEKDKKARKKLENFENLVKRKLCKFWSSPQDLGAVVSRSISQAKKNYPRTGWIRADSMTGTSEKEVVQLYKKIETLEQKLEESSRFVELNKLNLDNLADGEDKIKVIADIKSGSWNDPKTERKTYNLSWNIINYHLLPKIISPIRMTSFKSALNSITKEVYLNDTQNVEMPANITIKIANDFYETVKIQLTLLDLIKFYDEEFFTDEKPKMVKMVALTKKGKEKLLQLRAVRKK